MTIPKHGTLFNQHRIDHIAGQRKKARVMLREMATKLAMRLSYYEVYALMIGAIEDHADADATEIRRRAAEVTARCQMGMTRKVTLTGSAQAARGWRGLGIMWGPSMAENSKIEWTDHTFNPWTGCAEYKTDPALLERLQAAVEAFKALPPEAKRAMLEAQKKQWAESALGDLRSPT